MTITIHIDQANSPASPVADPEGGAAGMPPIEFDRLCFVYPILYQKA